MLVFHLFRTCLKCGQNYTGHVSFALLIVFFFFFLIILSYRIAPLLKKNVMLCINSENVSSHKSSGFKNKKNECFIPQLLSTNIILSTFEEPDSLVVDRSDTEQGS